MQLIQRFYDPTEGLVSIDGHNLKNLDLSFIRSKTAVVSQEPVLFPLSIREIIRLGRLDATDAEIEQAAKQANAHQFIASLRDAYETNVGEKGSQLSGGQRQKICIARALVRNPKILLLDEATSALDSESENAIQDALDVAKSGRTVVIIAHRLSTIKKADMIVGMMNGSISEMGTHDELMVAKGNYYKMNMHNNPPSGSFDSRLYKTSDQIGYISSDHDEMIDHQVEPSEQFNSEPIECPNSKNSTKTGLVDDLAQIVSCGKFLWKLHANDMFLIIPGVL
jgi:ABC-type transport system involved in cytochrome bd biosynthesis fused ATPase/permease subunit